MENYEIAVKFLIDEVEGLLREVEKYSFYCGVAQERTKTAKEEMEKEAWKALKYRSTDISRGNQRRVLDEISNFCKDWHLEGSRLERGNNEE